jgi:hypothetical protein
MEGSMADDEVLPPPRVQQPGMIKGLVPRLPERGHIKIGALGETRKTRDGKGTYQLPSKLDHFRITTLERDRTGNFTLDKAVYDKLDLGEAPTEIPIRLLYDDPSLNFPTRYACYSGKTLWCTGDGESAQRASRNYRQPMVRGEEHQVTCPCHRSQAAYDGPERCKMNGRLSAVIDGASRLGGCYIFRTTSYNSIVGILSSMTFLKSVTGGILANIPLRLVVQEKAATKPSDGTPVTVYIVALEFDGDLEELQERAHKIALDRATTHLSIENIENEARRVLSLLPPDAALPGDIPEDVIEEFYPEQNDREAMLGVTDAMPPRPTRESFDQKSGEKAEKSEPPPAEEPATTSAPEPETAEEEATTSAPDEGLPVYVTQGPPNGEEEEAFGGEEEEAPYEEAGSPPKLYPLVTEDGECIELPADQLVERFTQIFKGAATRGEETWRAIAADNRELVLETLAEDGLGALSQDIQTAWKEARPKPAAAAPAAAQGNGNGQTRAATPPPARPAPARPRAPAKASDEGVRADVWDREKFTLPRPMKADNAINFPMLRDVMMNVADQAQSVAELEQFKADNEENMRWLLGFNPRYAMDVETRYKQVAERLKKG